MRVVVVPPVRALLPEHAGIEDPVAELRAAAEGAVAWLLEGEGPVRVVAPDAGAERVAAHLLGSSAPAGRTGPAQADESVLVMANGSARRTEKAPGHLDERAAGFDEALGRALAAGDAAAVADTDATLAEELWATGTAGFDVLRDVEVEHVDVDYADDPYGVAYWVVRWTCAS